MAEQSILLAKTMVRVPFLPSSGSKSKHFLPENGLLLFAGVWNPHLSGEHQEPNTIEKPSLAKPL